MDNKNCISDILAYQLMIQRNYLAKKLSELFESLDNIMEMMFLVMTGQVRIIGSKSQLSIQLNIILVGNISY